MTTTIRVIALLLDPLTEELTEQKVVFGPERIKGSHMSYDFPQEYRVPDPYISYWVQIRTEGRWETQEKLNDDSLDDLYFEGSEGEDIFENSDQNWIDEDDPADNI